MIAQYQRKFNFTAIMVSHEIPDVYFISNRILALYDKTIVFQGTPEELGNFDHPFNDEVIHSLEGLQKELTGLYSKRNFKILNHVQLKRREAGESYCIAAFTLTNLDEIISSMGHDAAQELIHSMGLYIDKHFGAIGGFPPAVSPMNLLQCFHIPILRKLRAFSKILLRIFRSRESATFGQELKSRGLQGSALISPFGRELLRDNLLLK
jgi:hypothetical protein